MNNGFFTKSGSFKGSFTRNIIKLLRRSSFEANSDIAYKALVKLKRITWQKLFPAGFSLVLLAVAYNFLLLTHDLNVGGFTGLAMSLDRLGIPFTASLIALNAVPFVIAATNRRWSFFFASLTMTVLFGASVDFIPQHQLNIPGELSLVLGSILAGVGFGIICRIEASTGGSDMLAKLIIKLTRTNLSEGIIMTIIDFLVIVIWVAITGTCIILSTIAMLLSNIALDVAIYWGRIHEHTLIKLMGPLIKNKILRFVGPTCCKHCPRNLCIDFSGSV